MATAAQIQQLYIAYFGRPADPTGLTSWLTSTASLTQIAQGFGTAPEFTSTFESQTNAQQVNNLYINLFGRSAEPAGLNSWVTELNSGRLTLAQIGLAISSGAIGSDKVALDSKIAASVLWTNSSNGSNAGILAYSGETGISAGRGFLAPVTTTATIPTQAATDTQVQALISSNPSTGLTFNQITNNAILTSGSNNNGLNTAAGFTPAGSFLNGSNNVVKPGALQGGIIVDSGINDNDTLFLDQAFIQTAASVFGLETVNFTTTGGGLDVTGIQGVKTINFLVGSTFRVGANGASTAIININTTAALGFGSGLQLGGVNNILLNAANAGSLSLGGTTALTITNTLSANNTYTIRQNSAVGSFNFYAGSAATAFNLNFNTTAGVVTFSQGLVSGGGDFTLNLGTANEFATLSPNSASVFSFGNTGSTLVNYRVALAAAASLSNLSVSGVNTYQIATTAGGGAVAFSAGVQLKNGAISLGFGTAQTTAGAGIIFNDGGLNTLINANLITIGGAAANTQFRASGATDTLNLSFNTLSGSLFLTGGGFVIRGDVQTAITANQGIEILNLNIFGTTQATHTINSVTTAVGTTTFNLNAGNNSVVFRLNAANAVGSQLTTFGFSQSDGDNAIFVGTAYTANRLSYFDGSGNSFISLFNLAVSQTLSAAVLGTANSAAAAQFNTINISDGGNDIISLGGTDSAFGGAAVTGFIRANIIGMNQGDTLSFTQYAGSINSFAVITSNDGVSGAALSAIAVLFEGGFTYVFQTMSAAGVGGGGQNASANSLAAILTGNYASLGRWSLNANNLTLIS